MAKCMDFLKENSMRHDKPFALALSSLIALGSLAAIPPALSAQFRAADVEESVQKLYSDNQEDRASAGERLSEMGAEAKPAVPRLTEIVQNDPVMSVRGEAAKALGNIGPAAAPAVPALIAFLLNKAGGGERAYAATALGNIQAQADESVEALSEMLAHDDDSVVRQLSARALGDFKGKATPAVPVLIESIRKGNKDLRDAACDALAQVPASPRDVPALMEMLSDDISSARAAAAKSLTGAGDEAVGAVPGLIKLLQDSDEHVRMAAVLSLGSLGKTAKSALPALKLLAKNPTMKADAESAITNIKTSK
jgi:HEAT repeat protein